MVAGALSVITGGVEGVQIDTAAGVVYSGSGSLGESRNSFQP